MFFLFVLFVVLIYFFFFFFFQAEDGIRDHCVTGVQTCALPISYSLVPAGFRTGNSPPAGRDEFLLSVDSPATGGVTLTQLHGWKFHVDCAVPGNSTLGVGANHTPNANITVNGFVDAFTPTTLLVPQNGTTAKL